ncbi:MAG: hypothetical protein KAR83_04285 [Thermodesulfovibrionales bacterium]|nr:hypothetical protein [Thermodesulfovibrionales bacterium]
MIGVAAAGAIVLLLSVIGSMAMLHGASARVESARGLHDYLRQEQASLSSLRDKAQLFEAKRRNSKGKSVHEVMTQALDSLGLTDRLASLSSPPGAASAQEERAEARLEGITLNELVNLLFTLENSRMLILTRKANIRTSFENPELMNVTLSVSLIKPQ